MKQTFILILIFLGIQTATYTQEQLELRKEIGFKVGLKINEINDQRLASATKSALTPIFAFEYVKYNSKRKENLSISFNAGRTSSGGLLDFKWLNPEVNYTYQRKHKNIWIGGFFNSFTFLNFPLISDGHFNNNPIAYTVSHSIGPAISYDRFLGEKKNWSFNSSAQFALANHVIRPAYAHPYPEAFLNENNFDPTQKGMGNSFVKSGKLLTVNKYQNLNIVLGFGYYHNDDYKVSFSYRFSLNSNWEGHNSFVRSSEFLLGFSFLK